MKKIKFLPVAIMCLLCSCEPLDARKDKIRKNQDECWILIGKQRAYLQSPLRKYEPKLVIDSVTIWNNRCMDIANETDKLISEWK